MIGLLGGRMTTDDSIERKYRQNHREAIVRQNERSIQRVEEDNTMNEIANTMTQGWLKKEKAALAEENERLKKENEALRIVAANIMIDRRAIVNTINYLSDKWSTMDMKKLDDNAPLVLPEEAEKVRKEESERLRNKENYVEEAQKKVEARAQERIEKYMP